MTTSDQTAVRERLGTWFWIAAAGLCAAHLALATHFVPLGEVFSDRPLQGDDFDLHIGQVYRVLEGLSGWGKSWVYDVKLLAGQPEGTISDSGSKGWELWTFAAHALGARRSVAFNSFVLFAVLACPLIVFVAARLFGSCAWTALLAAALASCLWFFDSFAHWVWWVGMDSYACASYLSLLPLALFYRYLDSHRLRFAVGCGLLLGAVLLIHPYSFFILSFPMAALYLRARSSLPRSGHLAVVAIALFGFSVNIYWLRVAAAHWHYILNSAFYAQASLRYVLFDFFELLRTPTDTGVIGTRTGFRFLCFALALPGLWSWRAAGDRRYLPLGVALACLLVLAYLGNIIPGAAQIQPYRHILPATFFATLPAASFIVQLARSGTLLQLPHAFTVLLAAFALLLVQHLAAEVLYFLPQAVADPARLPNGSSSPISKYGFFPYQEHSHVDYHLPHDEWLELGYDELAAWIEANLPPGTRVLIDNPVLGERVAWKTNAEVIGGFLERNVGHAYANWFRHQTEQPIPSAKLADYLRTYAIGWVITQRTHPEFEHAQGVLHQVAPVTGRHIYRSLVPSTRVLAGSGAVRAMTNRIEVRASDPNRDLLLSYHWHEALRCEPDCRVERAEIEFDPVGLIRVPAPHPVELRIVNRY